MTNLTFTFTSKEELLNWEEFIQDLSVISRMEPFLFKNLSRRFVKMTLTFQSQLWWRLRILTTNVEVFHFLFLGFRQSGWLGQLEPTKVQDILLLETYCLAWCGWTLGCEALSLRLFPFVEVWLYLYKQSVCLKKRKNYVYLHMFIPFPLDLGKP